MSTQTAKTANEELFVGRLTGFRCNHCGACVYVNLRTNYWCPACKATSWKAENILIPLKDLAFIPIPDDLLPDADS